MSSVEIRFTKSGERRYVARYRDPARKSREKRFLRMVDAKRFLVDQDNRKLHGRWIDPRHQRVLLGDHVRRWVGSQSGLKQKTLDSYESLARSRVVPALGDIPLWQLDAMAIREWMAHMEEEELSASRIAQAVNLLGRVLADAVDSGLLERNPCDRIKRPRVGRADITPLSVEEVNRVAASIDERYEDLVLTLAYLGVRWGEVCALRWSRCNLLRGEIEIAESLAETSRGLQFGDPKNHQRRVVGVPPFLAERLRSRMDRLDAAESGLVFTAPSGGLLRHGNFLRRVWHPALADAGLNGVRLHDLRHTCASWLIADGESLVAVAHHLGHENPATTLRFYGHLVKDGDNGSAHRLEKRYRESESSDVCGFRVVEG